MDNTNRRPTAPGGEPAMDTGDWRTQLQPDSRQRIVNKIMETLKRHLPFSGQEGLQELKKIAVRFEEKIYTAATSQSDYLRKVSLKMLTMETKSQNTVPNSLPSNKPPDPGATSQSIAPQVPNQGQSLPMPLPANQSMVSNQSKARQPLLAQNIQNNIVPNGVQSSSGLQSAMPPVSSLTQTSISNSIGQNPSMQSISGVSQNSLGNSMGQGMSSNMFANTQRQMPGRQQVVPQQQQQPQAQNFQQYLYQQQQLQHQIMKQKQQQQQLQQNLVQQGNLQHSLVQSHLQQQQQQQQNLLQPNQLQSSQQSGMQSYMMQSTPLSNIQQNASQSIQQSTQSMLHQHPQSVLRPHQRPKQVAGISQQQTPMIHQQLMQQPQLMAQQANSGNMSQNQLIGQQNNMGDMQQQRLLNQQNNLQNLHHQQQQQQQQPPLMAQQINLSSIHQQQLGSQSNVSALQQQQQLLGSQSGNSSMQAIQHSVHMMQQPKIPLKQSTQRTGTNLLPAQGQQSQQAAPQQQLMSQIQSQPGQLQQQTNQLQRDMQQRFQASGQGPGSMLQSQNVLDQQKQLYQSQRPLPETSSTSLDSMAQTSHANGGDWPEEVYQKIKAMKEMYLHDLTDMHQKIAAKLHQHESLPQQPKAEQLEKLKIFKTMLERRISFLQVSKNNVLPGFKEKLGFYEKQIINFLTTTNRPRKPMQPMQQGQIPHMQSMQQPQTQISQVQPNDSQMNHQLQSMNMQGSLPTMQQNSMSSLQHNSLSSLPGLSTSQQNMMNSMQQGSNLDAGQANALGSLQQVPGALQQNPANGGDLQEKVYQKVIMVTQCAYEYIGTPGKSALPLLAEFTSPDGAHGSALAAVSSKSSLAEKPLERLIKAVKSFSKALSAYVGDIDSVVSMIDRIAGECFLCPSFKILQGNAAFKGKQWTKAVHYYTEAIKLNDTTATYYCNRAAAYLELGCFQQAEDDCSKAISLDKKNVKAYLRRGTARESLLCYKDAAQDFKHALVLEPQNKVATVAEKRLRKLMS